MEQVSREHNNFWVKHRLVSQRTCHLCWSFLLAVWHFSKMTTCTLTKPMESKTILHLELLWLQAHHTTTQTKSVAALLFHFYTPMHAHARHGTEDNRQELVSPPTLWGPGTGNHSSNLVVSVFTHDDYLACLGTKCLGHRKITPRIYNDLAFISCLDVHFLCF